MKATKEYEFFGGPHDGKQLEFPSDGVDTTGEKTEEATFHVACNENGRRPGVVFLNVKGQPVQESHEPKEEWMTGEITPEGTISMYMFATNKDAYFFVGDLRERREGE